MSEEDYVRGAKSSNLKQKPVHEAGDLEAVQAGGAALTPRDDGSKPAAARGGHAIKDSVGMQLLRLRAEWDRVRLAHAMAHENLARSTRAMDARMTPQRVKAIAAEAERQAQQDRAFMRLELKSLTPCRDAIHEYALNLAHARNSRLQTMEVLRIASAVLNAWIDDKCKVCTGRQFTGGSYRGEPQIICRACKDRRRQQFAKSASGQQLAEALLWEMDLVAQRAVGKFTAKSRG